MIFLKWPRSLFNLNSILFLFLLYKFVNSNNFYNVRKECPGVCIHPSECHRFSGKIIGYCGFNYGVCCTQKDYVETSNTNLIQTTTTVLTPITKEGITEKPQLIKGSSNKNFSETNELQTKRRGSRKKNNNNINEIGQCGTIIKEKETIFKNPNYPNFDSGSLVCKYDIELNEDTFGMRIDFLEMSLDKSPLNPELISDAPFYTICDSDIFFIKGFSNWMPDPRCGNLTGYSTIIDKETDQKFLTLVFVMSSSNYKWNLKISQIYKSEIDQANTINTNYLRKSSRSADDENEKIIETLNEFLPKEERIVQFGVPLVVAGKEVKKSSIPWQVSLQSVEYLETSLCGNKKKVGVHFCGGTILDEYHIASACHCFFSAGKYPHPVINIDKVRVVVGEHDLCSNEETIYTQTYKVETIIFHYNYLSIEIQNDIAILKLSEKIQFNQGVQPIIISPESFTFKSSEMSLLLSGWGSLSFDDNATFPKNLQATSDIRIIPESECSISSASYLGFEISSKSVSQKFKHGFYRGICTKGVKNIQVQAGRGDSGGPLVAILKETKTPVLIGIVSHKRTEVDKKTLQTYSLNYFAKVSAYHNWILMALTNSENI